MITITLSICSIDFFPSAREWFENFVHQYWLVALVSAGLSSLLFWMIGRARRSGMAASRILYRGLPATLPRPYRRSIHRLAAELERARRYRRSLAIVVVSVDFDQPRQSNGTMAAITGSTEHASPFLFSMISSLLRDNTRGSDILTYDATNDHFVMMLPESGAPAAEQTMLRLKKLVSQRGRALLRFGTAEYPADGLILQDLVSSAHARSLGTACEPSPQIDAARTVQGAQRTEPLAQSKDQLHDDK